MKKVMVIGHDGYLGHALTLRLLEKGYNVYGIDNLSRRRNVKDYMKSVSAIPIDLYDDRQMFFRNLRKYTNSIFESTILNVAQDSLSLGEVFEKIKPDVVVNLGQQPSGPFSHYNDVTMKYTIDNNVMGMLNIIQCMKKYTPNAKLVTIGTMGEYQVDIDTDIAEGVFEFEFNGRKSKSSIFPRRPGSIYHSTKVYSTYLIDCACRFWGLRAIDIMQGVVYGNWTPEIDESRFHTRLDSDEAYGTVINKFIVQALLNEPMTVYGKGLHKRGFLALNDSIQCLMIAINKELESGEYFTWNQLDEVFSMNDVADKVIKVAKEYDIKAEKSYIGNPRREVVDDHYYNPITEKLPELGFKQTRTIEDEVRFIFDMILLNEANKDMFNRNRKMLKKVVLPKIIW